MPNLRFFPTGRAQYSAALYLTLMIFSAPCSAGLITYIDKDPNITNLSPHPNSSAAESSLLSAAATLGTVHTATFEDLPADHNAFLSDFNLAAGPYLTLTGTPAYPGEAFEALIGNVYDENNCISVPVCTNGDPNYYSTTVGGSHYFYFDGDVLSFNFAQPVQAFGFYINHVYFNDLTITFNDGSAQSLTAPNPSHTYPISSDQTNTFGLDYVGVSDPGAQISEVQFHARHVGPRATVYDPVGIDDISYVFSPSATDAPEPGTFLLPGAALLLFAFSRKANRAKLASLLPVIAVIIAVHGSAKASPLAFATVSDGAFGTLDLSTGHFESIGFTPNAPLAGIAFHNDVLYGVDGLGTLLTIDLATSHTAVTGSTGSYPMVFTALPDGALYSMDSQNELYSIDAVTGQGTDIGQVSLSNAFGQAITNGFYNSLAGDENGLLFTAELPGLHGIASSLYRVNPVNASATFIGYTGIHEIIGSTFQNGELDVFTQPDYIYNTASIYRLDLNTGAATLKHEIDYTAGGVFGAAVAPSSESSPTPEPATWGLILSGGVLLAATRRSSKRKQIRPGNSATIHNHGTGCRRSDAAFETLVGGRP